MTGFQALETCRTFPTQIFRELFCPCKRNEILCNCIWICVFPAWTCLGLVRHCEGNTTTPTGSMVSTRWQRQMHNGRSMLTPTLCFLCFQIHVTEKYSAMLHSPRPQTTSPISFTRTGRGTKIQKSLPLPISMVFYASYSWTTMIYIKTSSAGCLLCFFVVVDIFVLVNLVSFLNNLLRRWCSAFLQIRRLQFLQRPAPHCEAAWKVLIAHVKWF